ncbi:MAG: class I SAM-dependent methyltransferase [bacterium]
MRADRRLLAAVTCVAAAVLMLEIVLTRIFSVTTQYHFAFLSVSLALFGLSAGGLAVRLAPRLFPVERAHERLAAAAWVAALAVPLVLALVHSLRVSPKALPIFLLAPALPFTAAGLALAIAYTSAARDAGRVYAADLSGAALGCVAAALGLRFLGGPGAMLASALLAAGAATLAAPSSWARGLRATLALLAVTVGVATSGVGFRVDAHKTPWDVTREFEAWNSFSRIAVMPMPKEIPPGWSMDARPFAPPPPIKLLNIDGDAGTILVGAGSGEGSLEFLSRDVTAFALGLLPPSGSVLIVGAGGGKDILAAREAGAQRIAAVEVNPLIAHTVNETYGAFTGRPYHGAGVRSVVADARSFLAVDRDRFDLVLLGLVDSWSATAAGAFFLTENHLYTTDAIGAYLDRLGPDGVASVSRWYFDSEPAETLRVAITARAALAERGIDEPWRHVVVLGRPAPALRAGLGVGVVLVRKSAWTSADLARIHALTAERGIELLYAPDGGSREVFERFLHTPRLADELRRYPLDVSPVSDDRPFFFQMLRMRDFFDRAKITSLWPWATLPTLTLSILAVVSAGLAALTLAAPLLGATAGARLATLGRLSPFAALGAGFFFVEVALVERLVLLVGQPTRALAVVLATLLLGTAFGGRWTRAMPERDLGWAFARHARFAGMIALGLALILPTAVRWLLPTADALRTGLAAATCLATGVVLGMPMPLLLRRLASDRTDLVPWAWAVNGAFGVAASVYSLLAAMGLGFRMVLLLGAAIYLLAARLARPTVESA